MLQDTDKTPTNKITPEGCECEVCKRSNRIWKVGNSFYAVSFGLSYLMTLASFLRRSSDQYIVHSVLKHFYKTNKRAA